MTTGALVERLPIFLNADCALAMPPSIPKWQTNPHHWRRQPGRTVAGFDHQVYAAAHSKILEIQNPAPYSDFRSRSYFGSCSRPSILPSWGCGVGDEWLSGLFTRRCRLASKRTLICLTSSRSRRGSCSTAAWAQSATQFSASATRFGAATWSERLASGLGESPSDFKSS